MRLQVEGFCKSTSDLSLHEPGFFVMAGWLSVHFFAVLLEEGVGWMLGMYTMAHGASRDALADPPAH